MKQTVIVEGLSELKDLLRELPDATAKNVLRRVGQKAMKKIADRAASLAVKRTGKLARAIVATNKLARRQRAQNTKIGDDVEIFAGVSKLPYGGFEEYGSVHNRPHPFMRPAWDGGKIQMLMEIKDDLWAEIEKAVARRTRKLAKS